MTNHAIDPIEALSPAAREHILRTARETQPNWYHVPEPDSRALLSEIWNLWGPSCIVDDKTPVWGIAGDELEALAAVPLDV